MRKKAEVLRKWEEIIKEYKASTKKLFCEQKGIRSHQLYYYENCLSNNNKFAISNSNIIPIKITNSPTKVIDAHNIWVAQLALKQQQFFILL